MVETSKKLTHGFKTWDPFERWHLNCHLDPFFSSICVDREPIF